MLRVAELINDSIVDGPGLRFTIFTQGCPHHCEGCHNPQTHDPAGGYEISAEAVMDKIKENPLLDGVTFSGGEPFLQAKELLPIARAVKDMGMNVIAYSGFTFEELLKIKDAAELLHYVDILIDGRFVLAERSLELRFRGSKNQRVLDVKRSFEAGRAIEIEI